MDKLIFIWLMSGFIGWIFALDEALKRDWLDSFGEWIIMLSLLYSFFILGPVGLFLPSFMKWLEKHGW